MPRAYLTIPSARSVDEVNACTARWKAQGYGVALWRDGHMQHRETKEWIDSEIVITGDILKQMPGIPACDLLILSPVYPGYAIAANTLIKQVLEHDINCDWAVCAGDDTFPDPNKTADEIARECSEYFAGRGPADRVDENTVSMSISEFEKSRTFGVMQPTGDRWQDTPASRARFGENRGALIDRVAGSAWIGREFARRVLRGNGPFYPQFRHMFGDQALQCVAEKLGVFWQRRNLTHYHDHAQRTEGLHIGPPKPLPPHMAQWSTRAHWDESKAEFERLQAGGFSEALDLLL